MASSNGPPVNAVINTEYNGRGVFVDDVGVRDAASFFRLVYAAVAATSVRTQLGDVITLADGLGLLAELCGRAVFGGGDKIILLGNGGSSAIASHIATDCSKNGGIRAIALNDAPMLTCLGNDFGIDEIFAKQLEYYALPGDVVIIVSSSGKSGNILRAAEQAFTMGLDIVTCSGMNADNVLRRKGMLNFFVPAMDYGIVEIAHLALLHSVVSVKKRWVT